MESVPNSLSLLYAGMAHYMHQMCQKCNGPTIAIFVYYDLTLGAGVVVMWKLHKSWYSCKLAHLYGFLVVTLWIVEVFGAREVSISGIIFEIMGELVIVEDSVVPRKYINQIVLIWRWQYFLFYHKLRIEIKSEESWRMNCFN